MSLNRKERRRSKRLSKVLRDPRNVDIPASKGKRMRKSNRMRKFAQHRRDRLDGQDEIQKQVDEM